MWWTYATKLLPLLRWADNAQNLGMGGSLIGMALLST